MDKQIDVNSNDKIHLKAKPKLKFNIFLSFG